MRTLTRSLLALAAAFAFIALTPDASAAAKKGPVDKPVTGKISAVDKEGKTVDFLLTARSLRGRRSFPRKTLDAHGQERR